MGENGIEHSGGAAPSRREFIRRGAIALGVGVWGVPLVQVVRSRQGGSPKAGPEEIGVQVVTAVCTTCVVDCVGGVVECGSNGVFVCFCAPSADAYPLADCICASEVFCDEAILCSSGCPEGWACAQGCCPEPICLPPCPDEPLPLAGAERRAAEAPAEAPAEGGRLTVTGRRL